MKKVLKIIGVSLAVILIAIVVFFFVMINKTVDPHTDFYVNGTLLTESNYNVMHHVWKGDTRGYHSGTVGDHSLFNRERNPESIAMTVQKGDILKVKSVDSIGLISIELVYLDPEATTGYGYHRYYSRSIYPSPTEIDYELLYWLDEEEETRKLNALPEITQISLKEYDIAIDTSGYDDAYKDHLIGYCISLYFWGFSLDPYEDDKNTSRSDYYFVFDIQE